MAFDVKLQRRIMSRFATGVALVTASCGEDCWGMTANSVLSVSLDPPLLLISVDKRNRMHWYLSEGRCFAINILSLEQEMISRRFTIPGPKDFSDLALRTGVTGAPVLEGSLGWIDCRVVEIVPGGDHDLFLGEPLAGECNSGFPLLFFAGQYAAMDTARSSAPLSSDLRQLEDAYALFCAF